MKLQTCEVITEACYTGLVGARPAMKFEACYMHYGTVVVIIAFQLPCSLKSVGNPLSETNTKWQGGVGGTNQGMGPPV